MNNQFWSWILSIVGITGFALAGRKVWWAWYVNIACQALWLMYALVTQQYGFLAGTIVYTFVFIQNAISWTREHYLKTEINEHIQEHSWPEVKREVNDGPVAGRTNVRGELFVDRARPRSSRQRE